MKEIKQVFVLLSNGNVSKCSLSISNSEPWEISLSGAGYNNLLFKADDLFKAFCSMRKDLEKAGHKFLCNGARKDIISSGMSRGMGGGRKAYVISKGQPARMTNMLDIFGYTKDHLVSTAEQEKFHTEWIDSLK